MPLSESSAGGQTVESSVPESGVQIGEIIANAFATILLIGLLAITFLISGKQFGSQSMARMVIILPVDPLKTAVFQKKYLDLPVNFDVGLIQPRPTGR